MAGIPTLQTRDLFAARLLEVARMLVDPTPLKTKRAHDELVRLAQG